MSDGARLDPTAIAALAVAALALLAVTAATIFLALRTREAIATAEAATAARKNLATLQLLVADAETSQRGYLLTDGNMDYLAPYRTALERLPDQIRSAGATANIPRSDAAEIGRLIDAKLAELARTVTLQDAGDHAGAVAVVNTGRGRHLMDDVRAGIGRVVADIDRRVSGSDAAVVRLTTTLGVVSVAAALIVTGAIGVAIWFALRFARRLDAARREVTAANTGLEARVRERTTALQQANEEVQRFAYIVSHDLRAPLVNVMGFTSELEISRDALEKHLAVLEADPAATAPLDAMREIVRDEVPESVRFIRSSTERMDGLIGAILRISREGQRRLNPEPLALGDVARRIAASVAHQLSSRDVELEIVEPLPAVTADRLAIEQILGNLIDNAAKYLDPARPGRIVVRGAAASAGWVGVEVEDNGRGIAPADQERIFELFRRAGRQDQKGEGIGLAHVRALLRRLGGEISVTSTPGRGSIFRVTLPRRMPLAQVA